MRYSALADGSIFSGWQTNFPWFISRKRAESKRGLMLGIKLNSWGIISFIHRFACLNRQSLEPFVDLIRFLLPEGTLDYFELVNILKDKDGLILFLEEKNELPEEYKGQKFHSKGFYPEVRIQDFPIREHKVILSIKRRRWENPDTGAIVSRDWDLVMKGTRLTKEFADFLKGTLG